MAELDQINVDGVHYDFRDAKAYQKPQDGIPASDLTSAIQALLTKASTALQPQDLNTLNSDVASLKALIESDSNNVIDKFNEIVTFLNGISSSSSLSGIVSDIATQINAKYTKPASGIPSTDLAQGVQTSLNKANTAYQKPSAGIPKTDLAQAVQTTLSNADTDHTNVATLQEKVSTIEGKIPSSASASNQLVDNDSLSEHYAKKDGAYEEMLAGSALNLVDTSGSPVLREFTFDTAGGSDDIGTGSALIKKMRGKTIVWNQKSILRNDSRNGVTTVIDGNEIRLSGTNNATSTIFIQCSMDLYSNDYLNHVFLSKMSFYGIADNSKWGTNNRGCTWGQPTAFSVVARKEVLGSTTYTVSTISECVTQNKQFSTPLSIRSGYNVDGVRGLIILIDLTQMFGAGNEPSTVEEFEKLFPMPYYDYNEGQLLSFNGDSIKTVGFNQWDEEYLFGFYNNNGVWVNSSSGYISSKNKIRVLPNRDYCFSFPTGGNNSIYISKYDANGDFVSRETRALTSGKRIITIPDGICYINFSTESFYGTTYNNDICINLSWSGTRNGTYEPYQEHVHDISFYKTIKDGDGNLLFPNGLLSAGSAYDEVTATKAINRIGVVDLGTLDWIYNTEAGHERFSSSTVNSMVKIPSANDVVGNVISPRFTAETATNNYLHKNDNTISVGQSGAIFIYSSAYTDAATFKAAMQGVMLYYELAEPIEVDFEEQNMAYQVNDYGTEQLLPENTSTPTTTPAMLDVTYGINAVNTIKNLPRNYLAQDDLDRLLSKMGSALGFTYTKTWNENDKQWSFTVTKTATTNDENV